MRSFIVVAGMMALVGCAAVDPSAPTKVSWEYGAGNGDGVAYPGPAPVYNRSYGWGADQVSAPAQAPVTNYAWGAENQSGGMVQQTSPQPAQQVASPAPSPAPAPNASQGSPALKTHS